MIGAYSTHRYEKPTLAFLTRSIRNDVLILYQVFRSIAVFALPFLSSMTDCKYARTFLLDVLSTSVCFPRFTNSTAEVVSFTVFSYVPFPRSLNSGFEKTVNPNRTTFSGAVRLFVHAESSRKSMCGNDLMISASILRDSASGSDAITDSLFPFFVVVCAVL